MADIPTTDGFLRDNPDSFKIKLESSASLRAKDVAEFLSAHDLAFRAYCRQQGVPPRGLQVGSSGTDSWWAYLFDAAKAYGILKDSAPIIAAFMTEFANILSLGHMSNPKDSPELFVRLLRQYNKTIKAKAVEKILIAHVATGDISICSSQQINEAILRTKRWSPPRPASVQEATAFRPTPKVTTSALEFSQHGTARKYDGTTYVRLEGMEGALLPAQGAAVDGLVDKTAYAFEGTKIPNRAGEPVAYYIRSAKPLSPH